MPQRLVSTILFDGSLTLEWEEHSDSSDEKSYVFESMIFKQFQQRTKQYPLRWMLILGLGDSSIHLAPSLSLWREFSALWIHQVQSIAETDEKLKETDLFLTENDAESFIEKVPAMTGAELIDTGYLLHTQAILKQTLVSLMAAFKGSVDQFFASIAPGSFHKDRIHFHLVENRKDPDRPFAFLATYSTRTDTSGRTHHQPLKLAFKEYADNNSKIVELLGTVTRVSRKNELIKAMLDSGEIFKPIGLTVNEAFTFLEGVADFEASGILCRIPRWWKGAPRKVAVTLSLGNKKPSIVGIDALLNFDVGLHLDGEPISEETARMILERAQGLVTVKGKWIPVDLESIGHALRQLEEARKLAEKEAISFPDAMRLLMGSQLKGPYQNLTNVEIGCGEWLKEVFQKMTNPSLIRHTDPSLLLKASLRHYQQQGLNWLSFMQSLGFGTLLADDMGLGKTVQILAHLQNLKRKDRTSLIVVPTSLLDNWRVEIEKFTPDLRSVILHPQMIASKGIESIQSQLHMFDCVITTYGMLGRYQWIKSYNWFYVICDEAQAMKNPLTGQAKEVKALQSSHRCAITGTPVENRLTDLWSIFDFVNPGLLGTFNEFKKFIKTLEDNPEGFGKLRRVVHPYILRRSKTDKTIISDLPDKVELKTWCSLTGKQVLLYSDLVKKLEDALEAAEGIERKGMILGYLSKFKQICNHNDHYAGNGMYDPEESGKFQRLAQLCETIYEKREKVLVFTQFAEIIGPLANYLQGLFGAQGLTLSGSTTVKKRKEAVERFQGSEYTPFFILSLKAGGVGLNLTAANHVIHFDRWWNPAVENQATDRAFRIGQKKNVMVHKFICKGTIEEKIDSLIDDKKKLASEITSSSAENWITELSDKDLKEMFRLSVSI
jgi:non-specific serine/threonine protein kinase